MIADNSTKKPAPQYLITHCGMASQESGTMGGRKEKEFVDADLTTGKHPTI